MVDIFQDQKYTYNCMTLDRLWILTWLVIIITFTVSCIFMIPHLSLGAWNMLECLPASFKWLY